MAMQIIITNLCHVLGALNTNCPFRRPLIGELSIGLLNNEVQHIVVNRLSPKDYTKLKCHASETACGYLGRHRTNE